MEVVADRQRGEDGVVDQGRAEVGQRARTVVTPVLVQVARDQVVWWRGEVKSSGAWWVNRTST